MKNYLDNYWNTGMMMGEFSASLFLLLFLSLSILYVKTKTGSLKSSPLLFPFLASISMIAAMITGWGVANMFENQSGFSLLIPTISLFKSIYYGAFKALPLIMLMQLAGSLGGIIIYSAFVKVYKDYDNKVQLMDGVVLSNESPKKNFYKSLLTQFLFLAMFIFISIWNTNIHNGNDDVINYINLFVLSLTLFLLLTIFSKVNYFMISPFISLLWILLGAMKKVVNKYHWINFMLEVAISFGIVITLSYIVYSLELNNV